MENLKTRKLNRLKEYDYSANGYYFVTICSKNREIIFGEYIENPVGTALAAVRYVRYENNIKLSKLGQIIENQWNDILNQYDNVQLERYVIMPNHIHGIIKINNPVGDGHAHPVNKSNNIPTIIGSFKWQRFFYDHHIRTTNSLNNIRKYILANPMNWDNDENNIKNNKVSGQACLPPTG